MADPFETLRAVDEPTAPDPTFAAQLRDRLARALVLSEGVTVSNVLVDRPAGTTPHGPTDPAVGGRAAVTAYLVVAGAPDALAWYGEVFKARLRDDPIVMPDGRIGHVELDIGGARVMLSEEHPEIGVVAPDPGAGAAVTLHLSVADVDAVVDRGVEAGARLERAPADHPYGRGAVIRDPFGHRWMVVTERPVTGAGSSGVGPGLTALHQGDLGYVSLWVPDAGRAAAFFSAVLGWAFEQDDGDPASPRRVAGHHLHHGLFGGVDETTHFCCYAVEDADEAAERIRVAGGTPADPRDEPYGRVVDATDPEGMRFAVFTPPGGALPRRGEPRSGDVDAPNRYAPNRYAPNRYAPNRYDRSRRQGDVVYVTMEVRDSACARRFYDAVLGWEATPGRVEDGWNVEGVSPMFGIAGGQPRARCVPLYQVDDVHAAVARVRAAGGRATDPEVQPYGVTSDAIDDQGTQFYLGHIGQVRPVGTGTP